MGLRETISGIFGRRSKARATTVDQSLAFEAMRGNAGASVNELAERFSAEHERIQVVKTCRRMYKTDPRIRGIIKTVARDAVKNGFRVIVKNNRRAEEEANRLAARLRLASAMDDWVRLTLRDGDSYLEVGVGDDRLIHLVTRKPTLQMHRESDRADRFADPAHAYWLDSGGASGAIPGGMGGAPRDALWFAEWQIIHARWDHDEGSRYGEPLFASAIGAFKRMSEGETDIAVRRKTRSGMRYVHSLEGATPADIEEYKDKNKDALGNPFAAIADFFVNKKATITAVQGDAHLAEIDDVLHHIRTLFVASPVPMGLLGYGQDLNRDILEDQGRQYARALEQITEWVESEIVWPLLERQWLLLGILPDGLDVEIEWMSKDPLTAQDIVNLGDAAIKLQVAGVPNNVINSILRRFLPGVDLLGDAQGNLSGRVGNTADALAKRVNGGDDGEDETDGEA